MSGIFHVDKLRVRIRQWNREHGDGLLPAAVLRDRKRESHLAAIRVAVDYGKRFHCVRGIDPRTSRDISVAHSRLEREAEPSRLGRSKLDAVPPLVAPQPVRARVLAVVLIIVHDTAKTDALHRLGVRRDPLVRRLGLSEEPPRLRTAVVGDMACALRLRRRECGAEAEGFVGIIDASGEIAHFDIACGIARAVEKRLARLRRVRPVTGDQFVAPEARRQAVAVKIDAAGERLAPERTFRTALCHAHSEKHGAPVAAGRLNEIGVPEGLER